MRVPDAPTRNDGIESIYETVPELCSAVEVDDPRATENALTREGFEVRWELIRFTGERGPAQTRKVEHPPADTVIVSVTDEDGAYENVAPNTRKLPIEVTHDPDGHPVAPDAACVNERRTR